MPLRAARDAGMTGGMQGQDPPSVAVASHIHPPVAAAAAVLTAAEQAEGGGEAEVRATHNVDCNPTRWPESPRIVMRCAPRASNGPNHLGLSALQVQVGLGTEVPMAGATETRQHTKASRRSRRAAEAAALLG